MKGLSRFLIIFGWVALIFGALYSPHLKFYKSDERSINIFAWGSSLDPSVLAEFEEETGIKIHVSYYSSNEELQVKMKATGGFGYDLVMPSDYAVAILKQADLLKPLDKSKLHFLDDINPLLINHPYDPKNTYSIPFEWEVVGLGVNTDAFEEPFVPSWKAVYDRSQIDYKIATVNDPIEAVIYAAFYLFGTTEQLDESHFQEIRTLLLEQRKWVEAYTDYRADYFLATGNCPIALSINSVIKRIRSQFANVKFMIPKEGTFISIENFCIPKQSKKEEYTYQLLNWLYRKESIASHYENVWLLPATLSALPELNLEEHEKELLTMSREEFKKFHFIKNIYPQAKVRNLWVEVKSF